MSKFFVENVKEENIRSAIQLVESPLISSLKKFKVTFQFTQPYRLGFSVHHSLFNQKPVLLVTGSDAWIEHLIRIDGMVAGKLKELFPEYQYASWIEKGRPVSFHLSRDWQSGNFLEFSSEFFIDQMNSIANVENIFQGQQYKVIFEYEYFYVSYRTAIYSKPRVSKITIL